IFKADTGFGKLEAVSLGHFIHHRSSRERFDDPSPALPINEKVMKQQADQLMCRKAPAVTVHTADPISIAISDQANVVWMLLQERRTADVILFDWLRSNTAK